MLNEGYEKLDIEFSYTIGDDNTDLPYKVLEYYNKEGVDIIFFQTHYNYYGTNEYYMYVKRRTKK